MGRVGQAESEGQRQGARGRFAEWRTQRRQRTARAGCERQQETETFRRRLCSLLTHRQALKITGLSEGKGEFSFQIIYFNLCHPSELRFLSLKSEFLL